jgi:hypothetical protein
MMNFGTGLFRGLNSQTAPHLLQDEALTIADNVDFDRHGSLRSEASDLKISAEGFSSFNGIGVASIGGEIYTFFKAVDGPVWKVFWFKEDATMPQVVGSDSILWGTDVGDRLRVYQGDNAAVLTDGKYMRVWDGQVLRKLGPPPEGTSFDAYESEVLTSFPVNSVTNQIIDSGVRIQGLESAHDGYHAWLTGGATYDSYDDLGIMYMVVYMVSPGDGLPAAGSPTAYMSDGDYLYVDHNVEMPRLKGKHVRLRFFLPGSIDPIPQPADPNMYRFRVEEFTIEDDEWPYSGSIWQWPQNVGNVAWMYPRGCGLAGQYGYGLSYTLKLPDEKVLESDLEALMFPSGQQFAALTLATEVRVRVRRWIQADIDSYILHPGPSYDPAVTIRLHRTKEGGPSYYELHEYEEPDSIQPAPGTPALTYRDRKRDGELGALYLDAPGTRQAPPRFADAVVAGNRFYVISELDRREMHFSFNGSLDYWDPLNSVPFPESLSGLGSMPGFVAAFSQTRLWLYDNDSGVPFIMEVPIDLGVANQKAIVPFGGSLFFANNLGLWELSGRTVRSVVDPIEHEWRTSGVGDWSGVALANKMIWSPGRDQSKALPESRAFRLKLAGEDVLWSRTDQPESLYYDLMVADPSRSRVLIQTDTGIYLAGEGSAFKTITVRSKEFGGGDLHRCQRLIVDAEADTEGTFWVTSNLHPETEALQVYPKDLGRRLISIPLPRIDGNFWQVSFVGKTSGLNGWWMQMERPK